MNVSTQINVSRTTGHRRISSELQLSERSQEISTIMQTISIETHTEKQMAYRRVETIVNKSGKADPTIGLFITLLRTMRHSIEEVEGFPQNEEFFRCNQSTFTELDFLKKTIPVLMEKGTIPASKKAIARYQNDSTSEDFNNNLEEFRKKILEYFNYVGYFSTYPNSFDPKELSLKELQEIFESDLSEQLVKKVAECLKNKLLGIKKYPIPPLSHASFHDYPVRPVTLLKLIQNSKPSTEEIEELFAKVHPSYLFDHLNQHIFLSSLKMERKKLINLLKNIFCNMPLEYFSKWLKHEKNLEQLIKSCFKGTEIQEQMLIKYALNHFLLECKELKISISVPKEIRRLEPSDINVTGGRNSVSGNGISTIFTFLINQKLDVLLNVLSIESLRVIKPMFISIDKGVYLPQLESRIKELVELMPNNKMA